MPDILFNCRGCRQEMVVDASGEGLTLPCPGCGQPVKVPARGDTGMIRVPEADGLKNRVAELDKALGTERKRAANAEASLKVLGERLEQTAAATSQAEGETRRLQRELETADRRAREEKETAQRQQEELKSERDALKTAQTEASAALARFHEETARRDDESSRQLAASREETAKRQQESARLTQEIEAIQTRLEVLSSLETQIGESNAQAEYFHQHLETLQTEHAKICQVNEQLTADLHETETRLRANETEREELSLAASAARQEGDLLQRNRDLAAHRDRLTVELAEARGALLRTETQLYHAMSAREGLTAMIWNLRGNLDEATEIQETMQSAFDTLETEAREMRERLGAAGADALLADSAGREH